VLVRGVEVDPALLRQAELGVAEQRDAGGGVELERRRDDVRDVRRLHSHPVELRLDGLGGVPLVAGPLAEDRGPDLVERCEVGRGAGVDQRGDAVALEQQDVE
jgi:hypothetical protein